MDRPPPTQRSKPGPCSGWTVPTKAMSWVSGETSWLGCPVSAVLNLRGRFEKRRVADVAALDLGQRRRAVDDLVLGDAGDGGAEERSRRVAARLGGVQAGGLEPLPDLRDVLDADPVVLDVLPVGDVGGVAGELLADGAERADRVGREQRAVGADAHHEELVVELLLLEHRGLAAVEAGRALGVEAHPAEPAAQVGRVDRGEAALGVDVEDPVPHVAAGRRPSWTARSCSAARCSRAPTAPHRAWVGGSRCVRPSWPRNADRSSRKVVLR